MIKQEHDAGRDMRPRPLLHSNVNGSAESAMHPHPTQTHQMRQAYLQELLQPPKTEFTAEERAFLDEHLPKYLAPEFTSTRQGPGRTTLTYVEAWRIKNVANRLFGFNGWSSTVSDVTVDFTDVAPDGRIFIGVSAVVRVTLKDGTCHEDLGFGSSENLKSKASSFEKAKKEAVTDALKRALTSFGNVLGSCLYDKHYCREISQFKPTKRVIHEHEYYRDASPNIPRSDHTTSRSAAAGSTIASAGPSTRAAAPVAAATNTNTTTTTLTMAPRAGHSMRPTPLTSATLNPPVVTNDVSKPPVQPLPAPTNTFAPNGTAVHSNNAFRPPQATAEAGVSSSGPAAANEFLPADPIEEDRIFHAESPRMSDLDIDMDILWQEESPVQVKQEAKPSWVAQSHRPQTTLPLRASSASPKDLPSVARQLLNNFRYTKDKAPASTNTTNTAMRTSGPTPISTTATTESGPAGSSTPTRRPFSRVSSSPSLSSPRRKQSTDASSTTGPPPQKPQLLQFQPVRNQSVTTGTVLAFKPSETTKASTTTSKDPPRTKLVNPYVTGQSVPPRPAHADGGSGVAAVAGSPGGGTIASSSTTLGKIKGPSSTASVSLLSFSAAGSATTSTSRSGSTQPDAIGVGGSGVRADLNHGNPFKSTPPAVTSTSSSSSSSSTGTSQGSLTGMPAGSSIVSNSKLGQKRPLGAESGGPLVNKEARLN